MRIRRTLAALAATSILALPAAAQADNPGFGPTVYGEGYMCSVTGWPPYSLSGTLAVEGDLSCSGNRMVELTVCVQQLTIYGTATTVGCSSSAWQWSNNGGITQGGTFNVPHGYYYRNEARGHLNYPAGSSTYYNGTSDSGWIKW
jgi:hypothetical protein